MPIVLYQGATESRVWTLDGTDSLTGASARLCGWANGAKVVDANLVMDVANRLIRWEILPATSSAWDLDGWGASFVTVGEGTRTGRGKRMDFQIEVLFADGSVSRVADDFAVVVPELVKP